MRATQQVNCTRVPGADWAPDREGTWAPHQSGRLATVTGRGQVVCARDAVPTGKAHTVEAVCWPHSLYRLWWRLRGPISCVSIPQAACLKRAHFIVWKL